MIRLNLEQGIMELDGAELKVAIEQSVPLEGCECMFTPGIILDETVGPHVDFCLFDLPPYGYTRLVRITGQVSCLDLPLSGNGWFMGADNNGIVTAEFDTTKPEFLIGGDRVFYDTGTVCAWVAGNLGAKILSITTPHFETSAPDGQAPEVVVEPGQYPLSSRMFGFIANDKLKISLTEGV